MICECSRIRIFAVIITATVTALQNFHGGRASAAVDDDDGEEDGLYGYGYGHGDGGGGGGGHLLCCYSIRVDVEKLPWKLRFWPDLIRSGRRWKGF